MKALVLVTVLAGSAAACGDDLFHPPLPHLSAHDGEILRFVVKVWSSYTSWPVVVRAAQ